LLVALRDPATYDVRKNAGLWLGFALALPIPVMAVALSAPVLVLIAALVAPLAWAAVVGASRRVGILSEDVIRRMRLEALSEKSTREVTYTRLNSEMKAERGERAALERLQHLADAELALAQVVQQSLVSSDIVRDDLVVAIHHVPCSYVGGDYIQATLPRPDLLYLVVGDVAGHGVAAALVVSRIHGLVQRLIHQEVRPGPFVDAVDRAMRDLLDRTSLFMTLAVFRIDLSAREIDYATAGHPPQLLLRSGGDLQELHTPNRPAGLEMGIPGSEHSVARTTYDPGDTLLLFTDGLFEVMRSGGRHEMWGEEKLKSLFVQLGGSAPGVVAQKILAEVSRYRGPYPSEDDVSMVVARLGTASDSREAQESHGDARASIGVTVPDPTPSSPQHNPGAAGGS
jgi:serine phosphatase RsbU (regulator of sigma subunit)